MPVTNDCIVDKISNINSYWAREPEKLMQLKKIQIKFHQKCILYLFRYLGFCKVNSIIVFQWKIE